MSLSVFKLPSLKDKQEAQALEAAEQKLKGETKQTKVETKKETRKKKK